MFAAQPARAGPMPADRSTAISDWLIQRKQPDDVRYKPLLRLKLVVWLILIWTVVGIVQAVPDAFRQLTWYTLIAKLIEAWTWALLTPVVLLIDRKITSAKPDLARLLLCHLALSIPISIIHTALSSLFQYPVEGIIWNPIREPQNTKYYMLSSWTIYCTVVGIIQAFKFQSSLQKAEKKLMKAHLNTLRLQLEPHFLFNTLNSISSEVIRNPKAVREMIEDLGALLRRSIEYHDNMEISLTQELALLNHYLSIQKLRFGKRIKVSIDVEPAVGSVMVPSMLLQPLIENAIQHGFKGRRSGGSVSVSAHKNGDHLQIKVIDDGVGLPMHWRMEACTGLGLSVTRERLEMLYSGSAGHRFTVKPGDRGGTEVTIRVPLQDVGGDAEGG